MNGYSPSSSATSYNIANLDGQSLPTSSNTATTASSNPSGPVVAINGQPYSITNGHCFQLGISYEFFGVQPVMPGENGTGRAISLDVPNFNLEVFPTISYTPTNSSGNGNDSGLSTRPNIGTPTTPSLPSRGGDVSSPWSTPSTWPSLTSTCSTLSSPFTPRQISPDTYGSLSPFSTGQCRCEMCGKCVCYLHLYCENCSRNSAGENCCCAISKHKKST